MAGEVRMRGFWIVTVTQSSAVVKAAPTDSNVLSVGQRVSRSSQDQDLTLDIKDK